ncbi:MAG: peptidase S8, partial [Nitrososphaeria archaeon]|nr:peptidase S8 [Nitrososphaeria archaeon]
GTVEELRISNPASKFEHTPLLGVYPVPTRYSYWLGDLKKNSTDMNYVLTASYYKKQNWKDIWLDGDSIIIPPHNNAKISATITVPTDTKPGLYQGFVRFIGSNHTVNAPVSFAVVSDVSKDKLVVIQGAQNSDSLYGNGYVKGAFDMTNRYNAGDWRQYYFDIKDPSIDTASINISWKDQDTNFSAFMIDPQGRIIQSNVPSGAFGNLLDWPTSDWLGATPFSEGGGFYPVKNKDATSSLLYAPINQTGTYTLLLHSTLFGGKSITEPFSVTARFLSLSADSEQHVDITTQNENLDQIPELFSNKTTSGQTKTVPDSKLDNVRKTNSETGKINKSETSLVDKNVISMKPESSMKLDYNLTLVIIAGVFAIGITIFIIFGNRSQKSQKY